MSIAFVLSSQGILVRFLHSLPIPCKAKHTRAQVDKMHIGCYLKSDHPSSRPEFGHSGILTVRHDNWQREMRQEE